MKMRIGLIGIGDIANEHIYAIEKVDGLELKALSDLDEKRNPNISGVKFYRDYKEMLKDSDLGAVTIATPNYLHEQMTIDSLDSGKHVLVEKPMAATIEQAERMTEAAKKSDKSLIVSYHFQFKPEILHFLGSIKEYGKINGFKVHISTPPPTYRQWLLKKEQSGGGPWIDNGTNCISMIRLFVNDLKVTKAEFGYEQQDVICNKKIEDYARVELSGKGVQGTAVSDWRMNSNQLKLISHYETSKGSVVLDHLDNTVSFNGKEVFRGMNRKTKGGALEKDRRYEMVYQDFLNRISNRTGNIDDSLKCMRLVVEAYELGNKNIIL